MKKKLLFMVLLAALVFAGCSDGSSGGNDDNKQDPGNNPPPTSPETPELPSTYIDISGTWYYTRIWHKEPLGEYTAVIKYEENKTLPSKLSFPMCIAFTCETIKPNGGFEGKWWGVYDRANNKIYLWNDEKEDYSEVSTINSDKISINLKYSTGLRLFSTMSSPLVLSRTSGSGSTGPEGPGNPGSEDLTLSGLYNVAEQSGVTLTFNSNGTWEKVYNNSQRKEGTYSQSGNTISLTYNGNTAEFTVSSSNVKTVLKAKNKDDWSTISVIGTGLQLSASIASGKVTLSK